MNSIPKCEGTTKQGRPCRNAARFRGYCNVHVAKYLYIDAWSNRTGLTLFLHCLGVASFLVTAWALRTAFVGPTKEMKDLTEQIIASPSYVERIVAGVVYDRRPLPDILKRKLQRLSLLEDSYGLLYPRAAIPVSNYYLWMERYDDTLEVIRKGLDVLAEPSEHLDLYSVGAIAIIVGKLGEEYATAKDWCDRAQLLPGIASEDERKRDCRYNKCLVLWLQASAGVGAYTADHARSCFEHLPKEDVLSYDPYTRAKHMLNLCKLEFDKLQEAFEVIGGRVPQPSTEQRYELTCLLADLSTASSIAVGATQSERDIIDSQVEDRSATTWFWLGSYEQADIHAHYAALAYERRNDPGMQWQALQLGSRSMRASGDIHHAARDMDDALSISLLCKSLSGAERAALILSKAAMMIAEDPEAGPTSAMDFLWNHADERADVEFQRAIIKAMLQLRADLLSEDPSYWGEVLKRAKELGVMTD